MTTETPPRKQGRPRGTGSYAAVWPLPLSHHAKLGIERLTARYESTSRSAIMRALLDLGLQHAGSNPAVLRPFLAPRLLEAEEVSLELGGQTIPAETAGSDEMVEIEPSPETEESKSKSSEPKPWIFTEESKSKSIEPEGSKTEEVSLEDFHVGPDVQANPFEED